MSAFYEFAKAEIFRNNLSVLTADIRAVLVDTNVYVYSAAHKYYSELSGVVGTETGLFANKTIDDSGVFNADDVVLPASADPTECEALVVFVDTGNPITDVLLLYIDQAVGLPVTPNNQPIDIYWNAAGIAKL